MEKPLSDAPVFDESEFAEKTSSWKAVGVRDGHRIVIEWAVLAGYGPRVFVYPASHRSLGIEMVHRDSNARIDERWADYLEYEYIPKIVAALEERKLTPQVICVDLRPLVVQRARRRALIAAGREKSGAAAH